MELISYKMNISNQIKSLFKYFIKIKMIYSKEKWQLKWFYFDLFQSEDNIESWIGVINLLFDLLKKFDEIQTVQKKWYF